MPRRKLSEYKAKQLVAGALKVEYYGWEITPQRAIIDVLQQIDAAKSYVVKVDQAVKGRFKKGLVLLDVKKAELHAATDQLRGEGYEYFIIEPYLVHAADTERYLSIIQDRNGYHLSYSAMGGVEIESHGEFIKMVTIDDQTDWQKLAGETKISEAKLRSLLQLFTDNHFVFLEINPYIVDEDNVLRVLDVALEVDDAGVYFTHDWGEDDFRSPKTSPLSEEEQAVQLLNMKSPASFNLSLLNPDGEIFLLLSGGGASVVVADEVYNQGYGKQLANYGEYSGNPNQEETQLYTAAVLQLLLNSKAEKKVLFIGGAVANFTDIANTFAGVMAAIDMVADKLHAQNVKVFVRRGGPRQEIGLAKIEACLLRHGILGAVYSPEVAITDVVAEALKEITR